MELEDVTEKYAQLKQKYWNPEWENMSEENKIKDPRYVNYLHEILIIGLEFAKGQKDRCTSDETRELIDITIKFYEDSLKHFTKTK